MVFSNLSQEGQDGCVTKSMVIFSGILTFFSFSSSGAEHETIKKSK
jgi:hypothetical protein